MAAEVFVTSCNSLSGPVKVERIGESVENARISDGYDGIGHRFVRECPHCLPSSLRAPSLNRNLRKEPFQREVKYQAPDRRAVSRPLVVEVLIRSADFYAHNICEVGRVYEDPHAVGLRLEERRTGEPDRWRWPRLSEVSGLRPHPEPAARR